MNFSDLKRGKLFSMAASLALLFSTEALLWQFPALTAGEKLASLAVALRQLFPQSAFALIRR